MVDGRLIRITHVSVNQSFIIIFSLRNHGILKTKKQYFSKEFSKTIMMINNKALIKFHSTYSKLKFQTDSKKQFIYQN